MINLRIFNYLKNIIEQFLNYHEICRRGPNYTPKMVKKAAERSLIKFFCHNQPKQSAFFLTLCGPNLFWNLFKFYNFKITKNCKILKFKAMITKR